MGLHSEPSSMMGTGGAMCVHHAPNVHQESASVDSRKHATDYSTAKTGPARHGDALRAGTCRRCGCVTDTAHAEPSDCIDALRETIAEIWAGEVRKHGRGPSK